MSILLETQVVEEVVRVIIEKLRPIRDYCLSGEYTHLLSKVPEIGETVDQVIQFLSEFSSEEPEEKHEEKPIVAYHPENLRRAAIFEELAGDFIVSEDPWLQIYERWVRLNIRR